MCMFQEGTGSVRFGSVPDFSIINRLGSVRFGQLFLPVRCGSACVLRTCRGSVRFGSVPCPVPAGSGIHRFGSVRPVRFGFRFLPDVQGMRAHGDQPVSMTKAFRGSTWLRAFWCSFPYRRRFSAIIRLVSDIKHLIATLTSKTIPRHMINISCSWGALPW